MSEVERSIKRQLRRYAASGDPVPIELQRQAEEYGVLKQDSFSSAVGAEDLSELTARELRRRAKAAGLDYTTRTTKAQLLAMLEG